MRYADDETSPSRFPDHLRPLLTAMLDNKRTFSADQESPPEVADAIRYESRPQRRMDSYEGEITDERAAQISEMFGFEPLDFQRRAWSELSETIGEDAEEPRAALVTAPTGFGKTEAFLGPVLDAIARGEIDNVALVYPRTALLRDQLSRVLELVRGLNDERDCDISVGPWYSDVPYYDDNVHDHSGLVNRYTNEIKIVDCWCEPDDGLVNAFELVEAGGGYEVQCRGTERHTFDDDEFVLSKETMKDDPPNVLLTTLQSLENTCLKPNYAILDALDAVVVDEVHLYDGLYGSHAAQVFRNVRQLKREQSDTDDSLLFVGSSATLADPERFGRQMFGVRGENVTTFETTEADFKPAEEVDDVENYYFLLGSEQVGLSSTYLQQTMLLGHTQLDPADDPGRNKMLSFIDSLSSVNQKYVQFRDADRQRKLWQFHRGVNGEDWDRVAEEMDMQFIDEPLSVGSDHSGTDLTSEDIGTSELLVSTSTLEVGIDLDDVSIVTQYHQPFGISSFVQRTGRAGRQSGDSHVVTFLDRTAGDKNLFHRADRFLEKEVTTPLNPDNRIVEWVHGSLRDYYRVASACRRENLGNREFFRSFLTDDGEVSPTDRAGEAYEPFFEFLRDPGEYVDDIVGRSPRNLFSERAISTLQRELEDERRELRREIEPIAQQLYQRERAAAVEAVARDTDPTARLNAKLHREAGDIVSEYESQLDTLEESHGDDDRLADVREDLEEWIDRFDDPSDRIDDLSEYHRFYGDVRAVDSRIATVSTQLGESAPSFDIGSRALDDFEKLLNAASGAPEERIREFRDDWQTVKYLSDCLDWLESCYSVTNHTESVYAIKHFLRALYFFDRYLTEIATDDETITDPDTDVWYVPESYFDSGGTTFSLVEEMGTDDEESSEESLFELFRKYYPFRAHFTASGEIQLFQPPTREVSVESGDSDIESQLEFDLSDSDVESRIEGEIERPVDVPLKTVSDCSGKSGRMILNYCPRCLEVLESPSADCDRHGDSQFGKMHANPDTTDERVETWDETRVAENLSLAGMEVKLQLDGVTVTTRPHGYDRESDDFFPLSNSKETESITLPSGQKLGFNFQTRGLVWDLGEATETVGDAVTERLDEIRDGTDTDYAALKRHTAAHLLVVLTADVAGVKPDNLRYLVSDDDTEIVVYEETEGGQGIVDLAAAELESRPAEFLDTLFRVCLDPEMVALQCWSSEWFRDELLSFVDDEAPLDSLETDRASGLVRTCLTDGHATELVPDEFETPHEELLEEPIQNATEEVVSFVDRLASVERSLGVDVDDETVVEIGHRIAAGLLRGESPSETVAGTEFEPEADGSVENLFEQANPDGERGGLQIRNCTEDHGETEQADVLSYTCLQRLRREMVSSRASESVSEHVFTTDSLPVTTDVDGETYYLSF